MPRKLWILVLLIIIIAIAGIIISYSSQPSWAIQAGTLIILAITLIVIIIYGWDTHRIANATEKKWEEELKPKLMYQITKVSVENQSDRIHFQLINPTNDIIEARINCNFKIYGEPVGLSGAYDGTEKWIVFPYQMSQGSFAIDQLLASKGKNQDQLINERNDDNSKQQLTMDLKVELESETGRKRSYPQRHHYFDFLRLQWIPTLTKQ